MNAQKETQERGAHLRSEFLDAFARLEEVIGEKIGQASKSGTCSSLTQKLNALEKAPFRHPAKIKQRIAEIRPLVECRNDIVHSALAIAELSGGETDRYFVFRNVAAMPEYTGRQMRALTYEEFKALIGRVKAVAKLLNDQPMKATAPAAPASAT